MSPRKPNPNHGDALLTSREVAQLYRVNPETVRRWVRKGILPVIRVGPTHRIRFCESQVQR
jgi:excisionase family DNA binding protein